MPYTVQFVGLVCFYRTGGARLALLPDGREPGDGIEPHYGSIQVAPEDVLSAEGWNGSADLARAMFTLPPCVIAMEGADASGTLDTTAHDGALPQLRQIDPDFEIDPENAETIARIPLRNGVLRAYRVPGGSAAISQLDVPHDGEILITVTPRDGSTARTLRLRPGTEVAIANMAQNGYLTDDPHDHHFRIYEKLSVRPVSLEEPATLPAVPQSQSQHMLFTRRGPIGLATNCTNTGCC
jgi:hypothetical protein